MDDLVIEDPEQVVLEAEPYKRLSYRWHTLTPEFAAKYEIGEDLLAKMAAERRSRATFELEPHGDQVKLTLTHDDFDPDSVVLASVDQGWPQLLSSLKTLLETGEPLPQD